MRKIFKLKLTNGFIIKTKVKAQPEANHFVADRSEVLKQLIRQIKSGHHDSILPIHKNKIVSSLKTVIQDANNNAVDALRSDQTYQVKFLKHYNHRIFSHPTVNSIQDLKNEAVANGAQPDNC